MSESDDQNDPSSSVCSSASVEGLRGRAWPCSKCSSGVTPIGKLFGSLEAGQLIPAAVPEKVAKGQIKVLQGWIASCLHPVNSSLSFPKLAEGSEHLVFLEEKTATVFKAIRPNIFGEAYYLDADGRINQKNCSPLEYLIRLRLWKKLFQSAPRDLGMSDQGQIVSSHKFITGTKPAQESVDLFLTEAGLSPVRQKYWLWKKVYPDFEIWVGDARDDNFVETAKGIVPIDIRVWFSGHTPCVESADW